MAKSRYNRQASSSSKYSHGALSSSTTSTATSNKWFKCPKIPKMPQPNNWKFTLPKTATSSSTRLLMENASTTSSIMIKLSSIINCLIWNKYLWAINSRELWGIVWGPSTKMPRVTLFKCTDVWSFFCLYMMYWCWLTFVVFICLIHLGQCFCFV